VLRSSIRTDIAELSQPTSVSARARPARPRTAAWLWG